MNTSAILDKCLKSVVTIRTSKGPVGARAIIDSEGSVVTSFHIIASAIDIKDIGTIVEKVINVDPTQNIAFLRIKKLPYTNLTISVAGNSDELKLGDRFFCN